MAEIIKTEKLIIERRIFLHLSFHEVDEYRVGYSQLSESMSTRWV